MEEERSIYPIVLDGNSTEEVAKFKRDARPAHYTFKINSFSQLLEFLSRTGSKKYESCDFEVAGYKWKLSLYPNGDSIRNESNHISLYLVFSETNDVPIGTEVNAFFKLFAYDQVQDQYLTVQAVSKKPMRFHAMKTECGFPRFLPLSIFNNSSNGYLVNDCCVFGVEIFVTNCTGKGESVSIKKLVKQIYTSRAKAMSKAKTAKELRPICPVAVTHGYVEEVEKVKRDAPPAHYTFKIESFSELPKLLSKTGLKKYESREFEVAGYKWKLSLYPNGDVKRNGSNHVSFYLMLSETNDLSLGSEVNAFFKLFVYDQIQDQYLTVQVQNVSEKPTRFHAMKTECGFPRFLPLNTFKDASSGYLVDDCCIFGAEIFVTNCTGKGESVSIEIPQETITFTMENFSKLDKVVYRSSPVNIAGYNWFLKVFPSGTPVAKDKHLSAFLEIASNRRLEQKTSIDFKIRVKNQTGGRHVEYSCKCCFGASLWDWGYPQFLLLSDLKDEAKGYMVNDMYVYKLFHTSGMDRDSVVALSVASFQKLPVAATPMASPMAGPDY